MTPANSHPAPTPGRRLASGLGIAAIFVAIVLTSVGGGWATATSVKTWYPELAKPSWTPPNWVFGPVWTILYLMLAVAASIVWLSRDQVAVRRPLIAFAIQLGANLAWSVFFFGLRSPLLAFLNICLLWIAVGVTVRQFFLVSRVAGWLMVPYWVWISFAAVLNAAIVWLDN